MKLAIHHREGSFSDQWIEYCKANDISFKIVNCYDSDIMSRLDDCDALLWQHDFTIYKDLIFAKSLLYSVAKAGKLVYPDFPTTWHYDDKVGQKYLLEAINAPRIPTYSFYDEESALKWANSTTYPKVFKLRGGSGARNVKLAKSKDQAIGLIKKSFGLGFSQYDKLGSLKERVRKYKEGKASLLRVISGVGRIVFPPEKARMVGREKGYAYFQDFIPRNDFDIRLIVINDKAYGMKRMNRKNDFRASGSSTFVYDPIPEEVLKIGFDVSSKLNLQSVAFDFVYDESGNPVIIEMSYSYGTKGSSRCKGYWDKNLNWHEGPFDPQGWIIEDIVRQIEGACSCGD